MLKSSPLCILATVCVFLACSRPSHKVTSAPVERASTAEDPSEDEDEDQDGTESDAPAKLDPLCTSTVFSEMSEGHLSLASALETTPHVTVASVELSRSDCSSVGHHHLMVVFDNNGEPMRAYRSRDLYSADDSAGSISPAIDASNESNGARRLLIGYEPHPPRRIDLSARCLSVKTDVGARILWWLPIEGQTEAELWRARLDTGICGRPGEASDVP